MIGRESLRDKVRYWSNYYWKHYPLFRKEYEGISMDEIVSAGLEKIRKYYEKEIKI